MKRSEFVKEANRTQGHFANYCAVLACILHDISIDKALIQQGVKERSWDRSKKSK